MFYGAATKSFLLFLLALLAIPSAGTSSDWQALSPGLEIRSLPISDQNSSSNASITILRIDPKFWELEVAAISQTGESHGHTAREWCTKQNFTAAINAGMFAADQRTHLGYLRDHGHINSGKLNAYQSVAVFHPQETRELPPYRILDLDDPAINLKTSLSSYDSAAQNLRLIKRPGLNQWPRQSRKWSEAALGEDSAGHILFIFSRVPLSMHDFNRHLLEAGIGIVAAQHLEGGPEAQLYLRVGKVEMEIFGSYETSFLENDQNAIAWPVPNVFGIRPRSHPPGEQ